MQARIVGAARGARWLAEGWRIFRAAPLAWLFLVFAYLVMTQIMAFVPVLGTAAAAVAMPGFSLGFMAVARSASRSGAVDLRLLFEGFREDARRQLALGLVYLGCGALVIGAGVLADGESALRGLMSGEGSARELALGDLAAPLAALALAYAPVMMIFWFAPPLCAWHSVGVVKALFFSFFGCLLNWRAFLAYGAVTAAAFLAINALLAGVLLLGAASPSRPQMMALLLPMLLVMLPSLFASFYVSYRDVFGYDAPP